jgi:hypothetical protein
MKNQPFRAANFGNCLGNIKKVAICDCKFRKVPKKYEKMPFAAANYRKCLGNTNKQPSPAANFGNCPGNMKKWPCAAANFGNCLGNMKKLPSGTANFGNCVGNTKKWPFAAANFRKCLQSLKKTSHLGLQISETNKEIWKSAIYVCFLILNIFINHRRRFFLGLQLVNGMYLCLARENMRPEPLRTATCCFFFFFAYFV